MVTSLAAPCLAEACFGIILRDTEVLCSEEAGEDCEMVASCGDFGHEGDLRLSWIVLVNTGKSPLARHSSLCTYLGVYSLLAKGVNLS